MLRRGKDVYAMIIMDEGVNLMTLKMTSNLLLKNVKVSELRGTLATDSPQPPVNETAKPQTSASFRGVSRAPFRVSTPPQEVPSTTSQAPAPERLPAKKRKRSFRGRDY
jgi:hypothetical protein